MQSQYTIFEYKMPKGKIVKQKVQSERARQFKEMLENSKLKIHRITTSGGLK